MKNPNDTDENHKAFLNERRLNELTSHAKLTIETLEMFLKRRGWTTGLKKWEKKLLYSAYEVMNTPVSERKFGLGKITDPSEIEKSWRP